MHVAIQKESQIWTAHWKEGIVFSHESKENKRRKIETNYVCIL